MTPKTAALVGLYLAAIIAANLSSSAFGPSASIVNAFLFIGLTLTTRDALHEAWGRNRWRNMGLLIAVGSGLSYGASILLADSAIPSSIVAQIALASMVAFAAAESLDAVVYHGLRKRGWPWLERANTSNVFSAAVDSVVFISIAFGFTWEIAFAQFSAKIAGGFIWSMLLNRTRDPEPEYV